MTRTITLTEVINDGSLSVRFDDKQFGTTSLQDLESYSYQMLEEVSGVLLRSLLFIEYMKNGNVNISATLNTDDPQGLWVKLDG
jgi:hypothetical protein